MTRLRRGVALLSVALGSVAALFPVATAAPARDAGLPPAEQPSQEVQPAADWSAAELPENPEDEGEAVLEETPEFLEDMPEQDRLWFEQRPPKDFDFDD